MTTTHLPAPDQKTREDIERLHTECLILARRTARLAGSLDHGPYAATGGRLRAAVGEIWKASELLHSAFHQAPPHSASVAGLCGRRMRYLAARLTRKAGA